jgi:large subunit ribosomal protein L11
MAKTITGYLKLQIKGGAANPGPPIAPILGSKGLSQHMMDFCKKFNEQTKDRVGQLLPVVITIYDDKSISFIVKSEPASVSILKALNVPKGSSVPNQNKIGTISRETLRKIAENKMNDLNAFTLDRAEKIIAGTARSMGVIVE